MENNTINIILAAAYMVAFVVTIGIDYKLKIQKRLASV
jgi:hypothetical protein